MSVYIQESKYWYLSTSRELFLIATQLSRMSDRLKAIKEKSKLRRKLLAPIVCTIQYLL